MIKTIIIALITLAALTVPANAAEYRCRSYCPTYNQCFSRCAWFYSEQELYERGQVAAERGLDFNSRGGTRRASPLACQNALEAGVDPDVMESYGCRN